MCIRQIFVRQLLQRFLQYSMLRRRLSFKSSQHQQTAKTVSYGLHPHSLRFSSKNILYELNIHIIYICVKCGKIGLVPSWSNGKYMYLDPTIHFHNSSVSHLVNERFFTSPWSICSYPPDDSNHSLITVYFIWFYTLIWANWYPIWWMNVFSPVHGLFAATHLTIGVILL